MSTLALSQPRMFFQGIRDGDTYYLLDMGDTQIEVATLVKLTPIGDFASEDHQQFLELFIAGTSSSASLAVSSFLSFAGISKEFLACWEPVAVFLNSRDNGGATIRVPLGGTFNWGEYLHIEDLQWKMGRSFRDRKMPASKGKHPRESCFNDVVYTVQFNRRPFALSKSPTNPPLPSSSLTNDKNLALVFPFEKKASAPCVLWVRREDLSNLSSMYRTMFDGGFSEDTNVLGETSSILEAFQKDLARVVAEERGNDQLQGPTVGDSDAEEDDDDQRGYEMVTDGPDQQSSPANPSSAIQYIVVRHASYSTYEAMLKWAATGEIQFAPLKSARSPSSFKTPSPKSIYKLAHLLNLELLQELAVSNFMSQLNHTNVLEELFSPMCFTYPVLQQAGLKVLEEQWTQVRESGALDNLLDMVDQDHSDARAMMKLAVEILKRSQRLGS